MTADRFLSRWMRRKEAARLGEPLPPEPPAAQAALDAQAPAQLPPQPVQELPTIESLRGISSEYQAFMQPSVDKDVKRAALKQLFADPHFHFDQMDRLDIYIDDYGIPDPIPAAMLAALSHAHGVLNEGKSLSESAAAMMQSDATPAAIPIAAQTETVPVEATDASTHTATDAPLDVAQPQIAAAENDEAARPRPESNGSINKVV
jgi:hypothetical protein